jgi:hypothetical protein
MSEPFTAGRSLPHSYCWERPHPIIRDRQGLCENIECPKVGPNIRRLFGGANKTANDLPPHRASRSCLVGQPMLFLIDRYHSVGYPSAVGYANENVVEEFRHVGNAHLRSIQTGCVVDRKPVVLLPTIPALPVPSNRIASMPMTAMMGPYIYIFFPDCRGLVEQRAPLGQVGYDTWITVLVSPISGSQKV